MDSSAPDTASVDRATGATNKSGELDPSASANPCTTQATSKQSGRHNKRRNLEGQRNPSRNPTDSRKRGPPSKRQKTENNDNGGAIPIYATQFSKEEIEAENRRPKKKVAVLMSYSGTGYYGMQMTPTEKTIEGDLFGAMVAAGAISKANATDPKKSSFVRCARTDKGVHAGGNLVSLKLIVEDPDVIKKINDNLSPQIRVWGYEIVSKSFSSYHFCDSRIYEYLIPTHCFLPPHPSTYLGQKLEEIAEQEGDLEEYKKRQEEVSSFWEDVDKQYVKPILDKLPEETRIKVQEALSRYPEDKKAAESAEVGKSTEPQADTPAESQPKKDGKEEENNAEDVESELSTSVKQAVKDIRTAYWKAKRDYRIDPVRLSRISAVLEQYVGTRNYHNYTVQKQFTDSSAKRFIKSFKISGDPLIINGTEWLSLKVHGQSFMMHQIRKMVAMAALLVRCGSNLKIIDDTYGAQKVPIPKAPGLGLLLERPIFDGYNKKAVDLEKNPIDFAKYEKEIDEFKQREIYERIFREEESTNAFGNFFNHLDGYNRESFLYVTSKGISAAVTPATTTTGEEQTKPEKDALAEVESESEALAGDEDV